MNILQISPDFNYSCGVSKHVFMLLRELKKDKNHNLFFLSNGGDSLERIEILGIPYLKLNFKRGSKNLILFITETIKLLLICMKYKIHIIHTHHRLPELSAVIVAAILKIKTITTVHSIVSGWKYLSFKSHTIIAVSKYVEKQLTEKFQVTKDRIYQLSNFVEPLTPLKEGEVDRWRILCGFSSTHKILLFVGRICRDKGCDVLISAFQELKIKYSNLKLILVGQFEDSDLETIICKSEDIIYFRPESDVRKYYQMCDIIVLPSRIDPFPYVMLEAGVFKKPFVGGNIGGIQEFINDGSDGLLVEPGNQKDLVDKISILLNDSNLAQKISHNLFIKVTSTNNMTQYIESLKNIYFGLTYDK